MRRRISVLIIKLAERCNLNCSYCYMYNHVDQRYRSRPAFMSQQVFQAVIDRLAEHWTRYPTHDVTLVFHGGEPMLFRPTVLDDWLTALEQAIGDGVRYGMQTNGTMVTPEWIDVLRRHRIHVSVSIDGPRAIHDEFRVDHRGRGSYDRTVEGLLRLVDAGLDPGVLCVVNPRRSGLEVYRHLRSFGMTRMGFLPPDATHDSKPALYGDLGPTPVADYLLPIFDEWFDADDPEVRIALFMDVIKVLQGGDAKTDTLGGSTNGQNFLVIDTDGSIQGTDVLKVCFENAAESGLNVLTHGFDDLRAAHPLVYQAIFEGLPLCEQCERCPERSTCGGGATPHRYSRSRGFDNPTIWCADMLKLIGHIRSRIAPDQPAVHTTVSMSANWA